METRVEAVISVENSPGGREPNVRLDPLMSIEKSLDNKERELSELIAKLAEMEQKLIEEEKELLTLSLSQPTSLRESKVANFDLPNDVLKDLLEKLPRETALNSSQLTDLCSKLKSNDFGIKNNRFLETSRLCSYLAQELLSLINKFQVIISYSKKDPDIYKKVFHNVTNIMPRFDLSTDQINRTLAIHLRFNVNALNDMYVKLHSNLVEAHEIVIDKHDQLVDRLSLNSSPSSMQCHSPGSRSSEESKLVSPRSNASSDHFPSPAVSNDALSSGSSQKRSPDASSSF